MKGGCIFWQSGLHVNRRRERHFATSLPSDRPNRWRRNEDDARAKGAALVEPSKAVYGHS